MSAASNLSSIGKDLVEALLELQAHEHIVFKILAVQP